MARTGDEEGEGPETQEGSRRLILRTNSEISYSRFDPNNSIFPSTCTLYFARTHAICRLVLHSNELVFYPLLMLFSFPHLHLSV